MNKLGFGFLRLPQVEGQVDFHTINKMVDIFMSAPGVRRFDTAYTYMDGAVTFWYNGSNQIYDATICYLEDMEGPVRRSVILEEIYNGLGPVQDTWSRADSIIYSGYSEPQNLTEIDELILKLLYHPAIECGMDAQECEAVIRSLYY